VQNPNILFFQSFLQIDNDLLDGFIGFDNGFIGLPCPKKTGIRTISFLAAYWLPTKLSNLFKEKAFHK